MKTTSNIDDRLIRVAKRRAHEEGKTLTAVIENALRNYLNSQPQRRSRTSIDFLIGAANPIAGVNGDDCGSIYQGM